MGQRVRNVGDQGRGLGVYLAALQAEPSVDAVGPIAEPTVGDGHGPIRVSMPRAWAPRTKISPLPPSGWGE